LTSVSISQAISSIAVPLKRGPRSPSGNETAGVSRPRGVTVSSAATARHLYAASRSASTPEAVWKAVRLQQVERRAHHSEAGRSPLFPVARTLPVTDSGAGVRTTLLCVERSLCCSSSSGKEQPPGVSVARARTPEQSSQGPGRSPGQRAPAGPASPQCEGLVTAEGLSGEFKVLERLPDMRGGGKLKERDPLFELVLKWITKPEWDMTLTLREAMAKVISPLLLPATRRHARGRYSCVRGDQRPQWVAHGAGGALAG
jgi:hypothetical protein